MFTCLKLSATNLSQSSAHDEHIAQEMKIQLEIMVEYDRSHQRSGTGGLEGNEKRKRRESIDACMERRKKQTEHDLNY